MKTIFRLRKLVAGLVFLGATAGAFTYMQAGTDVSEPAVVDVYDFKMRLNVPRIYDNAQSTGSRKYQAQSITGEMRMKYNAAGELIDVEFADMVNRTHRLSNGKLLTYPDTRLDDTVYPRFNAIGSNKTGRFGTASICFYLAAEPDYNIGEFTEDNALYVMLAGRGAFHSGKKYLKSASGQVAGTLGCGCTEYGHISPTRKIGYYGVTDKIDDVAAVYGSWSIRFNVVKSSKR